MTQLLNGLAQSAPGGGGSPLTQFVPLIAIFAIFYFLVLRPQSKKAKDHQKMLSELQQGAIVATQGGIIGKITGIKDNGEVTLQVQEGVRIRFLRSAITGVYAGDTPAPKSEKSEAKAS
ncbi:MAG TPA: preprotein translocase subunit YajC [Polyangia bacterium]|nr:preprotein translocase subunit YajC [Polyangia bacterium]